MGRFQGKLIAMLMAGACAMLGACGHSASSSTPLVKRHGNTSSGSGQAVDDSGPTDLVSAVSGGGVDEGPVGLKFQLGQRPESGKPVVVTLRLIANQPLDHLEARFRSDDGLNITEGGDFDPESHLEAGSAVDHTLTLLPDHDGVYTVMATVTTGSADEGISRSFVIPVVVGNPVVVPPPPPTPVAPAKRK